MNTQYSMITILGATASGKTGVAVGLAAAIDGEIISADSRQVYRGMDIGTGKDLEEYTSNNRAVPYHLIDIADAGNQYNVFDYQQDFIKTYNEITNRKKMPILCGGSGLYIEAVVKGYNLLHVPENTEFRKSAENKTDNELVAQLSEMKQLHNNTDTTERERLLRAIEIELFYQENPQIIKEIPKIENLLIGVKFDRNSRRRRITERLQSRLENGMIEEVQKLIDSGVSEEMLIRYGLEYKFITWYLQRKITYEQMFEQLNTAIHQFSKRQMTWFRKMERDEAEIGKIHWLDGYAPLTEKIERIKYLMKI